MKTFNAMGRLIANPLGAVVICAVGGSVIWLGLFQPPEGAPKVTLRGEQRTGQRTNKDGRSDPVRHDRSTATRTDETQRSRHARRAIATRERADAGESKATGRREVVVEEFEEPNESPVPPMEAAAADRPEPRPQLTGAESTTALTSDAIGPLDPRAKALRDYQSKKAAAPDAAADQKRLAHWCDERGLWRQAKTHWEAALRLDPKSDEARKRLGFRWRGGAGSLTRRAPRTWRRRKPIPTGSGCSRPITRRCVAGVRLPCLPGVRRSLRSKPSETRVPRRRSGKSLRRTSATTD